MSTTLRAACILACLATVSFGRQAHAVVIASDNFQSYASKSQLSDNGWTERDGDRTWTVTAPTGSGNTSSQIVVYGGGASGASIYKAFDNPAAIPSGTTDYYVSFCAKPNGTNAVLALWNLNAGSSPPNDSYVGPYFGVTANSFNIRSAGYGPTTTSTTVTADPTHWYEFRLQIKVNATTLTNSTGTLYYRDLTAGETTLHAISDLTDINLGFSSAPRNPNLYTGWRMRAGGGAEYDNLEFGTGTLAPVPEPAAIGFVPLVAGLLMLRRKS